MPLILCPCKSLSFCFIKKKIPHTKLPPPKFCAFTNKFAILGTTHVAFCSRNGELYLGNEVSQEAVDVRIPEQETLELLNKPSLVPIRNGSFSEIEVDTEKASIQGSQLVEVKGDGGILEVSEGRDEMGVDENEEEEEGDKKVNNAEYYEPKPGDFVVGIVVSGNENRLNVNVGAELPGTMLTKEVLPLNSKEMEYLICDANKKREENFMAHGRMGILKNDDGDAINGVMVVPVGNTVVEIGTILFAEVLGRTLTGRPLLSTRRLFCRIAWHRLRQIKQLNEPITIRVTEWNTSGLLTRIEGMRAFLPKAELVKRVNSFTELKENVGCCMYVQITEVDEAKNNVIVSQREAWEKLYLREGTLLEGTVKKILPYGAQIRIGETNRSGLLHVSNITRGGIKSVSDILSVGENVKVLVVKSAVPGKISVSIADLESEPGLFLSNRERVFLEADMMAKKYKEKLPPALATQPSESLSNSALPFENEALYANWKWFKFEK